MMNGGEAADQMVSYAFKGGEVVLRLSGSAAKNLAVYLANILKEGGPSKGKTTLKRMIADGSPLTVQRIKVDEIAYSIYWVSHTNTRFNLRKTNAANEEPVG